MSSLWSVYLMDVQTGLVGHKIEATGNWSDGPLNDIPSTSISIDKDDLPRTRVDGAGLHPILRAVWERGIFPWHDGVLVCFDNKPLVGGPIVEMPTETDELVKVAANGIEALLNQWIVLGGNYDTGTELAHSPNVQLYAENLSYLAWLYVQQSMARNGTLPIVAGMPTATGRTHYRNYEPYNVENNGLWKRITEITNVINGPDFAFMPEWVPGETGIRVQWRMMGGSTVSPFIAQSRTPSLDLSAPYVNAASFKTTIDWNPATRIYGHGNGEGAGMRIAFSTAPDGLRYRLPVLEDVFNESDQEDLRLLQQHVDGEMASRVDPVVQLTAEVDVDHQGVGIASCWTGENVQLTIPDRWILVPTGTKTWRCINRHGNIGDSTYSLELQEDGGTAWKLPG